MALADARPDPQGPAVPAMYLTPEQAAAMVQVCEKTLTRWSAADPSLPVLRIGGVTRYPRERLVRWLRDREQGQRTRNPLLGERKSASRKASRPAGGRLVPAVVPAPAGSGAADSSAEADGRLRGHDGGDGRAGRPADRRPAKSAEGHAGTGPAAGAEAVGKVR